MSEVSNVIFVEEIASYFDESEYTLLLAPIKRDEKNKENTVTCHICGQTLTAFRSLKPHIEAVHKKMRLHNCEKCEVIFFIQHLILTVLKDQCSAV